MRRHRRAPLALVAATLLLAACPLWFAASCAPARPAALRFVVTGHPLAAILSEVVAGRAEVLNLVPPGASPHTYEPRPSDLEAASSARALLFVSPLLDGWAARLPAPARIEVIELVPRAMRLPALETHDDAAGADASGDDPHFWTDPLLVKATLPGLVRELERVDPGGADRYRANADAFAASLDALDADLARRLAPVRGRAVLLFHPSFQYMLRRYGLVLGGVVEPSPGKEPTPRALEQVVADVRAKGIRAVFDEPQLPRRPAEIIAEAAGIRVRTLDPMGGAPGRTTYADLLRWNADALAEALR